MVQEAVQVVIGIMAAVEPEVGAALSPGLLDVVAAGAGVVGADRAPGEAAQQLRDGLTDGLAENIPQRDVEGRIAAHFGP